MLRFKEFLNEETEMVLDVDPSLALNQLEKVNHDLDKVTEDPFVNSALFINAVRGTLERFGIVLPPESNMQMLSMEGECIYTLGESGYYIYVVYNLNPDNYVEGYAQIVDADDLDALKELDDEDEDEDESFENPLEDIQRMRKQVRRSNDDSGNNNEYT